jgi:hypothetical protein
LFRHKRLNCHDHDKNISRSSNAILQDTESTKFFSAEQLNELRETNNDAKQRYPGDPKSLNWCEIAKKPVAQNYTIFTD